MIQVKATREGLVGGTTASGWVINTEYPYVALPSTKALFKWIKIMNPLNGRWCCAQVLDVGPFNIRDDNYVMQQATNCPLNPPSLYTGTQQQVRPLAEVGVAEDGAKSNGAGIDLGEKVWSLLGMLDNTQIEWEFIE